MDVLAVREAMRKATEYVRAGNVRMLHDVYISVRVNDDIIISSCNIGNSVLSDMYAHHPRVSVYISGS